MNSYILQKNEVGICICSVMCEMVLPSVMCLIRFTYIQIEADTGQTETYAQTKQRAVRLACALKKQDLLHPGETTMVCSENTVDNIIPVLATIFLGGHAASIDPMESAEEMAGALAYTEPKIIFSGKYSCYYRLLLLQSVLIHC